jgi:hypothetical protein
LARRRPYFTTLMPQGPATVCASAGIMSSIFPCRTDCVYTIWARKEIKANQAVAISSNVEDSLVADQVGVLELRFDVRLIPPYSSMLLL